MRILVLEDSKDRIEKFKSLLAGNDVWYTYESQECIDLLGTQEWDIVFLDHDLGGKVFCPSDENSGYAVANWLHHYQDRMPPVVIIHTMNPVGQRRMSQALPHAIKLPFWLICTENVSTILKLPLDKK